MEDMQQIYCKKNPRYEVNELLASGCHGIAVVDQGHCCSPGRALGEGSEHPAGSLLEWRSLYGRQNGWREPQFQEWDIPPDKEGDFISALHPFIPSDVHWSLPGGGDQHIAVGCADSVQVRSG